jgi:hypothetical protein
MWRDIYVGPGSIYVNGKKVIEDNSGTITVSTDADQNLAIATSGTGQTTIQSAAGLNLTTTGTADITFTTSTGQVNFDGDVIVNAAKSISSSNSDPITFADPISVSGNSTMANLIISGNLTVQGTTTTIDSTTVQIQNAFKFEGATADDFETTLTVTDPTADRTITLPDATGTAALLESTQTFTGATTFDASGNSVIVSDTLRIAQSGSGLRMTNVGAFDNDGSDNFRIYGTNNLYLRANGENGGGLSIDSTNQDVTIDNDLRVSAGQFYYGGTAVTSTATELNLLDGVTGTLVTEAGSQTLTNKILASPTVTGNLTVDTNTLFVDSTNNRVGIGTTSPAVGLDFQMINSGEGFRVRRHNASDQYIEITEGDGSRHEIKANGTKEFRITNTTADSAQGFHFFRNSAERLRILGDGLITFQDGAGTVAFTNSFTHFHSSAQTVTSGEATTNASGTVDYTFSELSGAIHYVAFLNRTLMRASEYSVSGTTLTVNSGVLATDDQIEVTGISV